MADGGQDEDRTEAATPRRLQRAREEGRAPISRELSLAAGLASTALAVAMYFPRAARHLSGGLTSFLIHLPEWTLADGGATAAHAAASEVLRAVAPVALGVMLVSAVISLLQSGFLLSTNPLRPDLSRISPAAGLRRLFSIDSLAEALRSLLKLGVLSAAMWPLIEGLPGQLNAALHWDGPALLDHILRLTLRAVLTVTAIQAVAAIADVAWVRLRHAKSLRMSREEVRQERRETDGDPRIKARIRKIREARARRRMMAAVPKATVVVTNPTHYAVALVYNRSNQAAPKVVAKGVDEMAARIRELAEAHRVPLVANPPVARALFHVELDADIPSELFQAVAEIIAYVWRLSRRAGAPIR